MNMKIIKGDKVRVVKNAKWLPMNIGDEFIVESVYPDAIELSHDDGNVEYTYTVSDDIFDEYFEKAEDNFGWDIDDEDFAHIAEILSKSKFCVTSMFGKCTVVACQLPNGFVIVESSSCVDPENYDEEIGTEICMNRIRDKVVELETYCDHYDTDVDYSNKNYNNSCSCEDCDTCPCGECT